MIEVKDVQVEMIVVTGKLPKEQRKERREFNRRRQELKQSLKTKD